MWQRMYTAAAAAALTIGCASAPPAVVLDAAPADAASLVGEWHGAYRSSESGRHGSILFVLRPSADSAYGEVLMVPENYTAPRNAAEASEQIRRPVPQVLSVAFVHAENGKVTGRMQPYRDPVCGCPLTTVFNGTLQGQEIKGTYTTSGTAMHPTQQGEWSVKRVK